MRNIKQVYGGTVRHDAFPVKIGRPLNASILRDRHFPFIIPVTRWLLQGTWVADLPRESKIKRLYYLQLRIHAARVLYSQPQGPQTGEKLGQRACRTKMMRMESRKTSPGCAPVVARQTLRVEMKEPMMERLEDKAKQLTTRPQKAQGRHVGALADFAFRSWLSLPGLRWPALFPALRWESLPVLAGGIAHCCFRLFAQSPGGKRCCCAARRNTRNHWRRSARLCSIRRAHAVVAMDLEGRLIYCNPGHGAPAGLSRH